MNGDQQPKKKLPATALEERQALLAHMVRLVARRLSFGLFVAGSGGVGKRPPDPLLARRSINQADLRKYVKRVLKIEDEHTPSTRLQNLVKEIVRLAESGRGNNLPSIRGTYWSAYNGVSEWLTYQRGRSEDSRLNSLWFGDSATTNRHALDVALDMAG